MVKLGFKRPRIEEGISINVRSNMVFEKIQKAPKRS